MKENNNKGHTASGTTKTITASKSNHSSQMCIQRCPKQKAFVQEYIIDLHPEKAAIRAGYKASHAEKHAKKLLASAPIIQAIEQALQSKLSPHKISKPLAANESTLTIARVVNELASIGFTTMADVCLWDASGIQVKESTKIPREHTAAIAEIIESSTGKGGIRIKLHAKLKALEMLGRHLGMFTTEEAKETGQSMPHAELSTDILHAVEQMFPPLTAEEDTQNADEE